MLILINFILILYNFNFLFDKENRVKQKPKKIVNLN